MEQYKYWQQRFLRHILSEVTSKTYFYIFPPIYDKYGDNFLDMDDDFSLYVAICETANNAIPKNQLLKKLFQSFQVNKEDIPDLKNVYQLD